MKSEPSDRPTSSPRAGELLTLAEACPYVAEVVRDTDNSSFEAATWHQFADRVEAIAERADAEAQEAMSLVIDPARAWPEGSAPTHNLQVSRNLAASSAFLNGLGEFADLCAAAGSDALDGNADNVAP